MALVHMEIGLLHRNLPQIQNDMWYVRLSAEVKYSTCLEVCYFREIILRKLHANTEYRCYCNWKGEWVITKPLMHSAWAGSVRGVQVPLVWFISFLCFRAHHFEGREKECKLWFCVWLSLLLLFWRKVSELWLYTSCTQSVATDTRFRAINND